MKVAEKIKASHDADWEKETCRNVIRILLAHNDPVGEELAQEFLDMYGEEV